MYAWLFAHVCMSVPVCTLVEARRRVWDPSELQMSAGGSTSYMGAGVWTPVLVTAQKAPLAAETLLSPQFVHMYGFIYLFI